MKVKNKKNLKITPVAHVEKEEILKVNFYN
jgi:hypothetical protein